MAFQGVRSDSDSFVKCKVMSCGRSGVGRAPDSRTTFSRRYLIVICRHTTTHAITGLDSDFEQMLIKDVLVS